MRLWLCTALVAAAAAGPLHERAQASRQEVADQFASTLVKKEDPIENADAVEHPVPAQDDILGLFDQNNFIDSSALTTTTTVPPTPAPTAPPTAAPTTAPTAAPTPSAEEVAAAAAKAAAAAEAKRLADNAAAARAVTIEKEEKAEALQARVVAAQAAADAELEVAAKQAAKLASERKVKLDALSAAEATQKAEAAEQLKREQAEQAKLTVESDAKAAAKAAADKVAADAEAAEAAAAVDEDNARKAQAAQAQAAADEAMQKTKAAKDAEAKAEADKLSALSNQNQGNFLGTLSDTVVEAQTGATASTSVAAPVDDPMAKYIQEMELQMGGTMPPTPPPTPEPTPAPTPYKQVAVHPTCTVDSRGHTLVTYNHQTDFKCTSHLPEGQLFIPALGKDGAMHAPFTYVLPKKGAMGDYRNTVKVIVHATAGGSVKQAILPEEAAQHCAVRPGLHLCTADEMHNAWAAVERYSSCACGWVRSGKEIVAAYPIKDGNVPGCGMLPNKLGGIVQCGKPTYADTYCCGDVGDTRDVHDKVTVKGAARCECTRHPYAKGCREIQHDWRLQHRGHAKAKYWHHRRAVAFADMERCKMSLDEVEKHNEMSWDDGRQIARVTYSPTSKRYNAGKYETPFSDAEEMCALLSMRLCSKRDLQDALDNEQYSDCSCGWNVDGHARYPVAIGDVSSGCGDLAKPASEVVDCGLHDTYERKADTFCCMDAPMLTDSAV